MLFINPSIKIVEVMAPGSGVQSLRWPGPIWPYSELVLNLNSKSSLLHQ